MNSEVLREILASEKIDIQTEKEKRERGDSQVMEESKAIEMLLRSEGWKVIVRDLEQIQEGFLSRLRHGTNLTKSQMDRYIECINLTEMFRKTPDKFILKMKMLLKRKVKGVA